jgi:hypothetical protein
MGVGRWHVHLGSLLYRELQNEQEQNGCDEECHDRQDEQPAEDELEHTCLLV